MGVFLCVGVCVGVFVCVCVCQRVYVCVCAFVRDCCGVRCVDTNAVRGWWFYASKQQHSSSKACATGLLVKPACGPACCSRMLP